MKSYWGRFNSKLHEGLMDCVTRSFRVPAVTIAQVVAMHFGPLLIRRHRLTLCSLRRLGFFDELLLVISLFFYYYPCSVHSGKRS